jgi:hypothetical protein
MRHINSERGLGAIGCAASRIAVSRGPPVGMAAGMEIADICKWAASISGMIAATIVALDWGRRDTGYGMVLFCLSAVAWIAGAALTRDYALGTQNVVLLGIDILGVYRYLIRDKDADAKA